MASCACAALPPSPGWGRLCSRSTIGPPSLRRTAAHSHFHWYGLDFNDADKRCTVFAPREVAVPFKVQSTLRGKYEEQVGVGVVGVPGSLRE